MFKVKRFSLFHLIVKKVTFIAVLTCGLISLSGCEKARVDAELERLCKQDGGLKIYETVALPADQLKPNGSPVFFTTWNRSNGGYKFISKFEEIKKIKPTLDKTTYMVIRESDNKILATSIVYLRIGGDILPRLGPDSFKQCPAPNQAQSVMSVFTIKNN